MINRGLGEQKNKVEKRKRRNFPSTTTENGIDKIVGKGSDDAGKDAADNDTDSHIHHVAPQGKSLKFLNKFVHFSFSFII